MKRLAIDMDEVIADANYQFGNWYKRDFNSQIDHINGKHFSDAVPSEHKAHVLRYPHTEGFFKDLPVMPGSQEVMLELSKKYEIFIASAAMEFKTSLVHKLEWMGIHFPYISWKNIVFCGDKSIINADYLIDDHVRNFKGFEGQGILFTAPHNYHESWSPRVNSWYEVGDLLLKQ
ncbi:MAG TPA: 5'(3')-deoxyribonucleotidase [Cyclobacteriaceae bacterium]|nr:5'(3')-deoxyribonucleotidase [Cyclobacteriaceae bacterium]